MSRQVLLGAIAGAHGVKGDIRVKTFTKVEADISAYGPLFAEDGRTFTLNVLRTLKPGFVVARAAEVTTREGAEALSGTALYLPRDALPAPGESEFYLEDLIGLAVIAEDGERIGVVAAIHNFGAGDIVEVSRDKRAEAFIPFTRACVPVVDLGAGVITISRDCIDDAEASR